MPSASLRPCLEPGCPTLVTSGRCVKHQHPRQRPNVEVRRLYYTERWTRLRRQVLTAAAYTCAGCSQVTLALDVHHIVPHRGDPTLFWDPTNLAGLCKVCHQAATMREQGTR